MTRTGGVCARGLAPARSVPRPPEASPGGKEPSIPLGGWQKNSRMMPGSCQPLARIGVACGPILLMAQTEEAGARVRRAEKQRRNRPIACKDALLMASGAGAAHARVARVQACTYCLPWAWGSQQPQTQAVRSETCMPLPGSVTRACPCSVPVFPVYSRGGLAAPACVCCADCKRCGRCATLATRSEAESILTRAPCEGC